MNMNFKLAYHIMYNDGDKLHGGDALLLMTIFAKCVRMVLTLHWYLLCSYYGPVVTTTAI